MTLVYLDTSAFVKTIVVEPESRRLVDWLAERRDRASCALLRTEAVRALRHHGPEITAAAREAFGGLMLIQLTDELLDAAGRLPAPVRSLDAIHLAAAQELGAELDAIVTYDERMTRGARELGLVVASP